MQDVLFPTKSDAKRIIHALDLMRENTEDANRELMDQVLVLLQMGMYINPRIFKPFYEDLHEIEHEEMRKILSLGLEDYHPYYLVV